MKLLPDTQILIWTFDRLLIAQARVEGMTLLTCDAGIALYPGPILFAGKLGIAK